MRLKRLRAIADGYLVPAGTGVAVYGFAAVGYSGNFGEVVFRDGGPTGTVKNRLYASAARPRDEDPLDGAGGRIEFADGVYVSVGSLPGEGSVLVYDGAST